MPTPTPKYLTVKEARDLQPGDLILGMEILDIDREFDHWTGKRVALWTSERRDDGTDHGEAYFKPDWVLPARELVVIERDLEPG